MNTIHDLSIHNSLQSFSVLQLANTTTGFNEFDGLLIGTNGNNTQFSLMENGDLSFWSGDPVAATNTQKMIIKQNGNVGIEGNPKEKFQIGNTFTFHDRASKVIARNYYYNGGDKRIEQGKASAMYFYPDGSLSFRVAGDGAPDSPINWINGLSIGNDGSTSLNGNDLLLHWDHCGLGWYYNLTTGIDADERLFTADPTTDPLVFIPNNKDISINGPVLFGSNGGALGTKNAYGRSIALRWDLNGRVGIGTIAPMKLLHIGNKGSSHEPIVGSLRLEGGNGANWRNWDFEVGPASPVTDAYNTRRLRISNNGSEVATIDEFGQVGIGTTNPGAALDIKSGTSSDNLRIGDNGSANTYFKIGRNTATGHLDFTSMQGAAFGYTFMSGNVGIGTIAPSAKLEVNVSPTEVAFAVYNGTTEQFRIMGDGKFYGRGYKIKGPGQPVFPDYVFSKDYKRMPSNEKLNFILFFGLIPRSSTAHLFFCALALLIPRSSAAGSFIKKYGHMPYLPPANEIEKNGLDVGEVIIGVTRNVEENTLDINELFERIKKLERENNFLKKEVKELQNKK